jgi:hypothetical protein
MLGLIATIPPKVNLSIFAAKYNVLQPPLLCPMINILFVLTPIL